MDMKSVSIQDLKRHLSGYLERAAGGESIVVTRHRKPVAMVAPVAPNQVWFGPRFGKVELGPVLETPLSESARRLLADDRRDSVEERR